jgi:hypothetical protein
MNELFRAVPTATHEDALTHETDSNSLLSVPTLGLETLDQEEPSHDIAHVWWTAGPLLG